jgi:hypothetical protein
MDTMPMLNRAIAAAKAGRKVEARQLLEAVLDSDERNERAWLWLSGVVDSDEERSICLENVLSINPDNQAARRGLAMLRAARAAASAPPIRPLPSPGPVEAAVPPAPGAAESPSSGDVVTNLLGRIEQQQSQARAARIPDNRMLILITIFLILLLVCSVIGIVIFSMMPAT